MIPGDSEGGPSSAEGALACLDVADLEGPNTSLVSEAESKVQAFLRLSGIKQGDVVLEPGCGVGHTTPKLAEQVGNDGLVISCDVSSQMIRRLRNRELPENVMSFAASTRALPLQSGVCDFVICVNVFQQFADKAQCLREFRRVLKPDGQLIIADLDGSTGGTGLGNRSTVQNLALPSRPTLNTFLNQTGFKLLMMRDSPQGYIVKAVRRPN